jgi:DNA modification methylase
MTNTDSWHSRARSARIDDLRPYPGNARTHSKNQIKQIAASIKEFGWTSPVLIDEELRVIAGHGRIEAARLLGMDEVPALEVSGLSDTQRRALILADNRIAENAGWDSDQLTLELRALTQEGVDALTLGFTADDLVRLLGGENSEGLTDPDEVPEPRELCVSQAGDVWLLGTHRLVCGDALKRDTYRHLLGDDLADLVVTDPPYGVAYHSSRKGKGSSIDGDQTQAAIPVSFVSCIEFTTANANLYFFGGTANGPMYSALFDHHLRMQPRLCIWVKERFLLRQHGYHSQFEQVYWCWKGNGGSAGWYGDRSQSDVWTVSRDLSKEREHPTQKPVGVYLIPIKNSAPLGGIVLEPFSGSGVCLIACEMLGRYCRAIELDPHYVDVGVMRWQKYTGKTATLEGSGRTFAEVERERATSVTA